MTRSAGNIRGSWEPTKGKEFDTGNVMWPRLVTADEMIDPYNLTMNVRVNGQVLGAGNSGTIHHKFGGMIVHALKGSRSQASS